ncbi:MAG: sodium:proton antiporter, partial [Alphaproteobacteria bacterium]|nr:sodium:proton antiporter [Alphaproteobacteria bacterium]
MMHDTPLISTLVMGLSAAFVGGMLATKLRLSPIVGYLMAGILIGPFTPGIIADANIATELSEIGIV